MSMCVIVCTCAHAHTCIPLSACSQFIYFSGQSGGVGTEGGDVSVDTGNCHSGSGTSVLSPLVLAGMDHGRTTTVTL